ncbi:type I restriction endonuclease subunit R [Candidatus Gracilibacteria bacterium]|nr:type I restriction endonuclease subunit R [Candidatus Gracilibacteria bacterium]
MKTNILEIGFEKYIEKKLQDLHQYEVRKPNNYDKTLCVDREIVLQFIKSTQPKEWGKLEEHHGSFAEDKFFKRLDQEIKARGLLDVLRKGIKDNGSSFDLAYFKPNTNINEETKTLYEGNIFTVIRQLKYSVRNENSIDMVLFLNGLPIFTIELKNQFTNQSVKNALRQYKIDRDPNESLLQFQRCLTHFAVDTEEVYMTTKLEGLKTYFLPFNKGYNMSAGNPPAKDKYKTEYMWEDIWKPDNTLEIISRFLCLQKEEKVDEKGRKKIIETFIFPRYHQLDSVRRLVADTTENGAGKNYLIQHSAGSGKSNSIAWLAHRLADLHKDGDKKIFDSVVIITDRRVLDKQLQSTVAQFEQVRGVVKKIDKQSDQLRKALETGEKIIITTLQKFPFIVTDMAALSGKNFAVIVDEAHSSQTGESVKSLKQVLGENEQEADTETIEDQILKEMQSRGQQKNVSFFAFTATPKQKTLEMFGEKQFDGTFRAFSNYSMKQAIDEGFILDILKNYTSYQMYFSLLKKSMDDPEYQKKKVQRLMIDYVGKHDVTINKKVEIMIDHFWKNIRSEIGGKAKAMIVTRSRLHAVRYKKAVDEYFKAQNLPMKSLVAFSGMVEDGELEYTESQMNGVPESQTAEKFKEDNYKFLIVAEKFQTGFDEPLLTAMYVDKKLGGVNCVQTLSRLNRTLPNKEETFVLDFVNETDDIKEAFQPYYTTTVLSEATDPNILHDLQRDILNYKLFDEREVDDFCGMYFQAVSPSELNAFFDNIIERFNELDEEEQMECKKKISDYIKKYAFISQIISFSDTSLEKLYIFLRLYRRKLPINSETPPLEVLDSVDLESIKIPKVGETNISLEKKDGTLDPIEGSGRGKNEDEIEILSRIIKDINERFGTDFSLEDRIILNNLTQRLLSSKSLVGAIKHNQSKDSVKIKFDEVFSKELISMFKSNFDLYQKLDSNVDLKDYVNNKMFDFIHQAIQKDSEKT